MDGVVVSGMIDESDMITVEVNNRESLVEITMETSVGNETVLLDLENTRILIAELQKAHNSLLPKE